MANDDDQRVTNNNNNNEMINWRKKDERKARSRVRVEGATGTGCGQCTQGSVVSFLISFFLIFCLAKPDPAPLRVSTHTQSV